ncbi:MAG: hypothetical protein LBQ88_06860 [Treponema sp.]|jgi:hypothetical protein|nr:hypothetical protein [Treponema sp.]
MFKFLLPFKLLMFLLAVVFPLFPAWAGESDGLDNADFDEERPVKVLRPGGPLSGIPVEETPEYARLILEDILKSPDMGGKQESWGIRFKESGDPEQEIEKPPSWMEDIKKAVANIFRFILVLGITVFAAFAFLYFYRKFKGEKGSPPLKAVQNRIAPAPAVSAESYLVEARRLSGEGRPREAWAACLAGSLAAFRSRRGISFPAGATEYGCLALIRTALRQRAGGEQQPEGANPDGPDPRELEEFTNLVHNWIYFAYAGLPPPEGAFEKALNLGLSLLPPESRARNSEQGKSHA